VLDVEAVVRLGQTLGDMKEELSFSTDDERCEQAFVGTHGC